MEGRRHRLKSELLLHRDFSGSRLEEQVLKRAFELVIPTLVQQVKECEPLQMGLDRGPVRARQSQGA
jgi:hypothetical protein